MQPRPGGFAARIHQAGARTRLPALVIALVALITALVSPVPVSAASAPPVPGNNKAVQANDTTIHQSWSRSSGATSYLVTNGDQTHTTTGTGYDWTGLAMGKYMCTAVAAVNSAGQSAWSPYSCVTIKPATPTGVTAVATSQVNIHISWNAVPGATGYEIGNGNDPTKTTPYLSYDWKVTANTYMCFNVRALQLNGKSDWTPWACATAQLPAPTGVTVSTPDPTTFHVTWQPVLEATSYLVTNGDIDPREDIDTTFTWKVKPNTYMCFGISAKNSAGGGAQSPWTCATTPNDTNDIHYVNLGDSLSSGEGTKNYTADSSTTSNQCHRSDQSYSGQYVAISSNYHSVVNVACSGSETYEFYNDGSPNQMGTPDVGEQPQENALDDTTTLVTLSFGINDIDFADLLRNCYGPNLIGPPVDVINQCFITQLTGRIYNKNTQTMSDLINGLYGPLKSLYTTAHNLAPNATILAVTYPQIYPAKGDQNSNINQCLDRTELRAGEIITSQQQLDLLRGALNHLDDTIVKAATDAGISFLDERDAFKDHELCTADPWENQIILTPNGAGNDSFHPNTEGYAKYAADLKYALGS